MKYFIGCTLLLLLLLAPLNAQIKKEGLGGGVGIGGTVANTDLKQGKTELFGRAFLRYPLVNHIEGDFGAGIGEVRSEVFRTRIIPFDYRFVISPFEFESWNPYLYAGAGVLRFEVLDPPAVSNGDRPQAWTGMFPAGVGAQFKINDQLLFEMSGGYNQTMTDDLDAVKTDHKDGYWNFLFGLTATGVGPDRDPDKDGLLNDDEKQLGTDPNNPDTDGDGLSDGDEVNVYHTNPLKPDSDGDGLNDGDEVKKHKTDPNKADTDGDGLKDGEEVMKYTTDPLKADTDGDGLKDGEEVNQYKTDPLKADTDGGSVNDGTEVANKTNPLDPSDDVPKKKEEFQTEVGKAIVLDGIVFKSGSAEITSESEDILTKAYNTLEQNPEIEVEIDGHTDNSGRHASNMKLSQNRADAVKTWLTGKGIAASRITTKGFGPDKPIASNKTAEGKQKNRRIEFLRTK
ncbi:MAG TPA: OmpA family protein [Bacteroidota bacterium]|jgi:outer membrane protein OmpA-like peptidoglycan-associated protein|nr:OmpA family protein [Bacteroidota bacterium]